MKRWSVFDALSLATLGIAAAITAGVYDRLPRNLPTHFDARGIANGYMPRAAGAWLPLGIALVTWALLRVAPLMFPSKWRDRMDASPMSVVALLLTLTLVGMHMVVIHGGLAHRGRLPGVAGALLGSLWLLLSLVTPRIRRNPLVGVRTPWALASDENWARTHHFAGYSFAAGGLVAVAASLAGAMSLGVGAIIVSALLPAAYSFFQRATH